MKPPVSGVLSPIRTLLVLGCVVANRDRNPSWPGNVRIAGHPPGTPCSAICSACGMMMPEENPKLSHWEDIIAAFAGRFKAQMRIGHPASTPILLRFAENIIPGQHLPQDPSCRDGESMRSSSTGLKPPCSRFGKVEGTLGKINQIRADSRG
jgi:hypothetical protein